jgi:hypothetical protein
MAATPRGNVFREVRAPHAKLGGAIASLLDRQELVDALLRRMNLMCMGRSQARAASADQTSEAISESPGR